MGRAGENFAAVISTKYYPFIAYLLRDAPTGLTFNNFTLCPHCIYVFCIYLRTNSDLCHLQHKLVDFYNRDEKCLQRGTDWVFKQSGLSFVCKGLNIIGVLHNLIYLVCKAHSPYYIFICNLSGSIIFFHITP